MSIQQMLLGVGGPPDEITSGDSTLTYGGYTLEVYSTVGSRSVTIWGTYDILLVGGGGQGGHPQSVSNYGGGGGAGGLVWYTGFRATGDYTFVVGDGGSGTAQASRGEDGGDTTAFGLTALGGGGGGTQNEIDHVGRDGGSGGGNGYADATNFSTANQPSQSNSLSSGSLVYNLGYRGGSSGSSPHNHSGGGGGAGAIGATNPGASTTGNPGAGFNMSSLVGTAVGVSGWFAGGGGGVRQTNGGYPAGGQGGGGGGQEWQTIESVSIAGGVDGTGGGGGGGGAYKGSRDGGSGIIIVRYPT